MKLAIALLTTLILTGCAAPGTRPLLARDVTQCVPMKGPDSKIRYRDKVYQQYRCPGYGYLTVEIIGPGSCPAEPKS